MLLAGAVLLLASAAVGVARVVAEPLRPLDPAEPFTNYHRFGPHEIRTGDVAADARASVFVSFAYDGPTRLTIADVRSATVGVTFTPRTDKGEYLPPASPYRSFVALGVAPGDHVSLTLATNARCAALRRATVELVYAGGRTQRFPLSGGGPGTCAGP